MAVMMVMAVTATMPAKPAVVAAAVIAATVSATVDRRRIDLNTAKGRIATTVISTAAVSAVSPIIGLTVTSAVCTSEIVVTVAVVNGDSKPRSAGVTLCHRF